MKNKALKTILSKTAAVSVAASMAVGMPAMAAESVADTAQAAVNESAAASDSPAEQTGGGQQSSAEKQDVPISAQTSEQPAAKTQQPAPQNQQPAQPQQQAGSSSSSGTSTASVNPSGSDSNSQAPSANSTNAASSGTGTGSSAAESAGSAGSQTSALADQNTAPAPAAGGASSASGSQNTASSSSATDTTPEDDSDQDPDSAASAGDTSSDASGRSVSDGDASSDPEKDKPENSGLANTDAAAQAENSSGETPKTENAAENEEETVEEQEDSGETPSVSAKPRQVPAPNDETGSSENGETVPDRPDVASWAWVKGGIHKTTQHGGNDKQRRILKATDDKGNAIKDSEGNPIEILSTGGSINNGKPAIQNISDAITLTSHTNSEVADICNGCDTAWISANNILLYAKDDPNGKYKAGDKILYTDPDDGKQYYLYFTDQQYPRGQDKDTNGQGYYDTFLIIPKKDTVDNIAQGLQIDMVDWRDDKPNYNNSAQDGYIKRLVDPENFYRNGERKSLTYKKTDSDRFNVTVAERNDRAGFVSIDAVCVDNDEYSYVLIPGSGNDETADSSSLEGKSLYYFGHKKDQNGNDLFLTATRNTDGSFTIDNETGWMTPYEIEHVPSKGGKKSDNLFVLVTDSQEENYFTTKADDILPVQYISSEKGVFSDTLGKDGYPTISEKYDVRREEGKQSDPGKTDDATSLKELFDAEKFKGNAQFGYGDEGNAYRSYFQTNGLLQLDEDGKWVYDSQKNFASLVPYGYNGTLPNGSIVPFVLFKHIGTPNTDKNADNDSKVGNFLPYNTLDSRKPGYERGRDEQSDNLYGLCENNTDFQFGMKMSGSFVQTPGGKKNGKNSIFEFSGDDDMVVYIDGRLALDLSGIHDALSGTIDFANGTVTTNGSIQNAIANFRFANLIKQRPDEPEIKTFKELGFTDLNENGTFRDGTVHDIKIFYMERGKGASNLKLGMNMQTVTQNKVTSSVKKDWNDGGRSHEKDSVAVTLWRSTDGGKTYEQVDLDPDTDGDNGTVLNEENGWAAYKTALDRYVTDKDGNIVYDANQKPTEIVYEWREDAVDGYRSSSSTEDTSTEEHKKKGIFSYVTTFINTILGKVSIQEEWNDGEGDKGKYGTRPDSTSVKLQYSTDGGATYQDYDLDSDTEVSRKLNNGNGWLTTANLPQYDKDKKKITYRWVETGDKIHYRSSDQIESGTPLDQMFTIVNTLQARTSVTKTWDDDWDKDGVRPDSISLILHQVDENGKEISSRRVTVKPDENGQWTASELVDRYDENNHELRYYWTEEGESADRDGDGVADYAISRYVRNLLGRAKDDLDTLNFETAITNRRTVKQEAESEKPEKKQQKKSEKPSAVAVSAQPAKSAADSVPTGDTSEPGRNALLMIVSAAGIGALLRRRKKHSSR